MRELYERARPNPLAGRRAARTGRRLRRLPPTCSPTVGYRAIEAEIRLLAAEDLVETDRRDEGEEQAARALDFYRSVGATFYLDRGEALLGEAEAV